MKYPDKKFIKEMSQLIKSILNFCEYEIFIKKDELNIIASPNFIPKIILFLKDNPSINMESLISKTKDYLNKFLEVGVLLLSVSIIAEILFGPNVPFFGSTVTNNLINLLNNLGDQGIAALIVVFALMFVYRKLFK